MLELRTDDASRRESQAVAIKCQRSFQIVDADRNQRDSGLHEVPQSPDRDKQRSEKDQHHCLSTRLTLPSRLIMGMCRLLKEQSRPWLKSYVVPDPFRHHPNPTSQANQEKNVYDAPE